MQYRPEIDGLRAVAVASVVLYHAGLPYLSGGFLGVDIFFVISGFLITQLLLDDLAAQQFSIAKFYERRARRLLPALTVVLIVCVPWAWALNMPSAFGTFGESMAATAVFLSNVHFWQDTDYFNAAAMDQPLLHTWSLAIEEQFYLIFPLVIWLCWRFSGQLVMLALLCTMALLSFLLSIWGWEHKPDVNYYFTFSRFWELLAGAIAAILQNQHQLRAKNLLALAGSLMVATALFGFDAQTPHPSTPTLLPVSGTVLILLYANAGTPVGRILSHGVMVKLGLISYSLYLWHQPVFAFGRILLPDLQAAFLSGGLVIISLVLGTLSWRFIERPFRISVQGKLTTAAPALWSQRKTLAASVMAIATCVAFGRIIAVNGNVALPYLRADAQERAVLGVMDPPLALLQRLYLKDTCFFEGKVPTAAATCLPERTDIAIWGDSHAAALSFGLREGRTDVGLLAQSGCAPLIDDGRTLRSTCAAANVTFVDALIEAQPRVLVLHANWLSKGSQINLLPGTLVHLRKSLPEAAIVVVGGVPQWRPSLPERIVMSNLQTAETGMARSETVSIDAVDTQLAALIAETGDGGILFLRPQDLLCKAELCRAFAGVEPVPYAWDYGHLTENGSRDLAVWLRGRLP